MTHPRAHFPSNPFHFPPSPRTSEDPSPLGARRPPHLGEHPHLRGASEDFVRTHVRSLVRTPSACCARVGPCKALMRVCVQWRGLVWRGWLAAAFKVCPLRASHPHCALRGTSPQLRPPWLRAPSACCARVGLCGALMRVCVQWRGLVWRGWPAAAFKVCPLRATTPCTASRRSAALHGCARRVLAVHA